VQDAHAEISGASNATVNASGTLSAEVSGASHLYYTGSPTLGDIETSGASSVNKK
jgi:ribosomal protein L31